MSVESRVRTMEKQSTPGECRCRLEIVHSDKGPVPTAPPKRCPNCGGDPIRVVITYADPSVNYAPERWAHA